MSARHVMVLAVVALVASCWRTSGGPKDPDETETATERQQETAKRDRAQRDPQQVQFLKDSEPTDPSEQPAPGTYVIAGCNTGCNGCAIGDSTNVHGVDVASGKELFPHPTRAAVEAFRAAPRCRSTRTFGSSRRAGTGSSSSSGDRSTPVTTARARARTSRSAT